MARASNWLKAFTRDADFVAAKVMTCGGRDFVPGEPFDKTLCSTRQLRRLYEWRRIKIAPAAETGPDPRDELEIPEDWAALKFLAMKSIAAKLDPNLPNTAKKVDIVAIIEAEIARREGPGEPEPAEPSVGPEKEPAEPDEAGSEGSGENNEPGEIAIPENWRELEIDARIALAVALTGEAIGTDEDAVAVIELIIESREIEANGESA